MSLDPGLVLGHYRVIGKIGEGGMGEVYEAHDTVLDRKVALKVLPPEVSSNPDRLERFRREARAIAALNHPNIITIHGIEEDGERRFLVMERVEGTSLDRLIPPGGLPLARIFDLAVPMAEALAAAHAKRIVHRDFKPANVMVTSEGQVKVLDFGLALIAAGSDEPDETATQVDTRTPTLTAEGHAMGTAPYMSPEQIECKTIDHRSDLFSLGVVLYEMASGRRPFRGDSTIALASGILKDAPAPVTGSRDDLPRHLGRIIHQCLEKDPDRRFQTARDVRNQLASLEAETLSGAALVPQRSGRPRWLLPAAAVALVALVATVGGLAVRHMSAPAIEGAGAGGTTPQASAANRTIVVLPFENLGEPEDEYFADGMTEEITSRLAALAGLKVISRTSAMQYKSSRPSLREIGEELGVGYVLEGTVRWQKAADGSSRVRVTPQLIEVANDTHIWAERYDRVLEDIFEVQSDIARRVSEQLGVALAAAQIGSIESRPTENLEAYVAFLRGNDYLNRGRELSSAEPARFAVKMYEEAVRLDPGFAAAYARLSSAHEFLYNMHDDRTEARLTAARSAVETALLLEPDLPEGRYALGVLLGNEPDRKGRALVELERALERAPNNAEIWEAIGWIQTDQGLWEEGIVSLTKAMELNPKLGRIPCSVGGSYWALRDFEKAILYHKHAIRLTPDRSCPYVCELWIHMNRDGDTRKAREVLETIPKSVGLEENPPILLPWVRMEMIDGDYETALERLFSQSAEALQFQDYYIPKDLLAAQIYGLLGRPSEEKARYESAAAHLEAKLREWPDDGRVHSALGIAYAGLGRRKEAIRQAVRGTELPTGGWGDEGGYRVHDLAQVYLMVGDPDAAIDQLEKLLSTPSFFAAPYLAVDPTWEALRGHPRFEALLRKRSVSGSGGSA